MSSTKKAIIGICTFLPMLFLILYMVSIFSMVSNMEALEHSNDPGDVFGVMGPMFLWLILMIVFSFAMLIFYIIDIVNNPKFQGTGSNNKLIWLLVVILGGMVGMIVYFFVEIYPREEVPPLP